MIARHFPSEDYRKTLLWVLYILLPVVIFISSFAYAMPVEAHGGAYCGTSERWVTANGNLYRQVFRYHYANDDHHWTSQRYIWSGTGYVLVEGSKHGHRTDCGHNH